MNTKDIAKLIELFHVCPNSTEKPTREQVYEVNDKAVKLGFVIHPSLCGLPEIKEFLKNQVINYNSTFYKEWSDITSKSRFELFIDQILHYSSTYGTNWSLEGNGYVPNEGAENVPELKNYTIIYPCTTAEMFDKCKGMIYSGIALDSVRTKLFCDYIIDNIGVSGCALDPDKVKNREALVVLCKELNILPRDRFNLLRYIMYYTTGNSMIINNKEYKSIIMSSSEPFPFEKLDTSRMIELSKIFLRFKDLFLAFKHNPSISVESKHKINRLRRFAVKYHEPIAVGMWENILDQPYKFDDVSDNLDSVSNFKLITLMQTIRERLLCAATPDSKQAYIVRNGKVFVKDSKYDSVLNEKYEYWSVLYKMFENKLVENLKEKACIVKFPEGMELTCPTSEKNFVGNLPMGSNYEMNGENFFGIYWKEEWGTRDFDLSFTDSETGEKIGWDSNFRTGNNSVIFSGDMTSANPEATEVLYCAGSMPDGVISVNRFFGDEGSKFKVFFGSQDINPHTFKRGYMVDPNCIKMTTETTSTIRQQMIGIVCDGKAYMLNLRNGDRRSCWRGVGIDMFNIFKRKALSFINLKSLLLKAGFVEYDENNEEMNKLENNGIGLDLTDLKKDTLIDLFTKKEN